MKLLTKSELRQKIGYSPSHIDRLEKAGCFPRRVKPFGPNGRAFWPEHEVDDWVQQKMDERGS
jgi:prophage regulatory protein